MESVLYCWASQKLRGHFSTSSMFVTSGVTSVVFSYSVTYGHLRQPVGSGTTCMWLVDRQAKMWNNWKQGWGRPAGLLLQHAAEQSWDVSNTLVRVTALVKFQAWLIGAAAKEQEPKKTHTSYIIYLFFYHHYYLFIKHKTLPEKVVHKKGWSVINLNAASARRL